MTKKEYLDLIKEIGTAVRAAGIAYGRVFSDKRKSTGYRTKFWYIFGGGNKIETLRDVKNIAQSIGGDDIDVIINCGDVIITPKKLS